MRHLPNLICLLRIALVWPILVALHAGQYLTALALFVLAAVSDGLDGYLAKRFGWTSELGRVLDPLADKLLLIVVFVSCTWHGLVPWWLTAAVVARDFAIGGGALIFQLWFGALHGQPMVLSKINTAAQLLYVSLVLLRAAAGQPPHGVLAVAALITLATTCISGAQYVKVFGRRAWLRAARS